MKDAGFALSETYTELLAGLTYEGKAVRVYSLMADNNAVAPYVILGPWVPQSDNTKSSFGQKGEINLSVVTRFTANRSRKPASIIANDITELLKPTPTAEVLNPTGFRCWNTIIVGTTDLPTGTATDTIYQKIITVSHSLTQL